MAEKHSGRRGLWEKKEKGKEEGGKIKKQANVDTLGYNGIWSDLHGSRRRLLLTLLVARRRRHNPGC